MKYMVTFIMESEVSVTIKVDNDNLNSKFLELGNINSTEDFLCDNDPRWEFERIGYEYYTQGKGNYKEFEIIVDRRIERLEE